MNPVYDGIRKRIIEIGFRNIHKCRGKSLHVSVITLRKRIVSIGWNDDQTTHTLASKFGYYDDRVHSELHAITRFPLPPKRLRECIMYNMRVTRHGKISNSKPCIRCQELIQAFRLRGVQYTNPFGYFEKLGNTIQVYIDEAQLAN